MRHYATSRIEPISAEQRQRMARLAIANGQRRLIKLKFRSMCEVCGHEVPAGTSAWWSKGQPAIHEGCVDMTGIEPYEPPLNRRESARLTEQERIEHDEYVKGRLEDRDGEAAWKAERS